MRGGSSKRVGSRRNTCRGKLCNNACYFVIENGLQGGSQQKRARGTRGGVFGPSSPPINALVKILAIGYSQRSLKSFPLRSNYDLRGPDN